MTARPDRTPSDADRRLRQACRVARTLALYRRVADGPPPDVQTLATELECSPRTVHRDLQTLELAGIPVWFDRDAGGYRLHHSASLPSHAFPSAAQERSRARQHAPSPGRSDLRLQTDLAELDGLPQRAGATPDLTERLLTERLKITRAATRQHTLLRGRYRSPYENASIVSEWQPHHVLCDRGIWYVIATDVRLEQPRTYRLQRFEELAATSRSFVPSQQFSPVDYFRHCWRIYRGSDPETVVLRVRHVDRFVSDFRQPATTIERDNARDATVTLRIAVTPDFIRWLLARLDTVTVISPRSLRDRLAEHFKVMSTSLAQTEVQTEGEND